MDSRIKFEQWLGNPLRCKIDENGNYLESALQMMWEGWQACSEDTDELKQQHNKELASANEHIKKLELEGAKTIDMLHQRADRLSARIAELEAYNATRTDEMIAATRRIKELEAALTEAAERQEPFGYWSRVVWGHHDNWSFMKQSPEAFNSRKGVVGSKVVESISLYATPQPVEKQEPVGTVEIHTVRNAVSSGWSEYDIPSIKLNIGHRVKEGDLLYTTPQPAIPVWQPIETAPKDKFLLLCGPSGYTTTPVVFTTGRMCSDYRIGRWIDHANDDLTNWGFYPTHWMPLPAAPEPENSK